MHSVQGVVNVAGEQIVAVRFTVPTPVEVEVHVETGLLGISHINYWTTPRVQNMIASKLALDWLKLNGKISDDEFQKRLAVYDQGLINKA